MRTYWKLDGSGLSGLAPFRRNGPNQDRHSGPDRDLIRRPRRRKFREPRIVSNLTLGPQRTAGGAAIHPLWTSNGVGKSVFERLGPLFGPDLRIA
jgi:hypothetical protein